MKSVLLLILAAMSASAQESEVLKDFSVGNNLFAADIYRELLKSHSGNFLVCPLSAEMILALAHNGADGKTAQELSFGLHLPETKKKIQEIIEHLTPYLQSEDKFTLNTANKIYIKDGYKIQDQFKSTAVNIFKSEIQNINFENNNKAAAEMNKWVEKKTQNKIKDLVDKDDLNEDTRAVLINAMYFHGKWVYEFPADATTPMSFYPHSNKQIQVDMMQQLNDLNYYESSELHAKFLELPYEGNDVTMTIVLPNEKEGLPQVEAHLSKVLAQHNYEKHLIELKLPKFEIKSTIEFKPILEALGIVEAFTDGANFGGIIVDQPLKISKVVQKAFIEVEEHGTIASAATAVQIPAPVIEFVVDHPFIYFIKIKKIIFFIGRYTGV